MPQRDRPFEEGLWGQAIEDEVASRPRVAKERAPVPGDRDGHRGAEAGQAPATASSISSRRRARRRRAPASAWSTERASLSTVQAACARYAGSPGATSRCPSSTVTTTPSGG